MQLRATILLLLAFSILTQQTTYAQAGVSLNTPASLEGYTLIQEGAAVYLIDNCGGVINGWTAFDGFHLPKLLPDGNLMYYTNNGVIEKDWDNNIVKQVNHNDNQLSLAYEVVKLPSGNYLSAGRRAFSQYQFLGIGYDLSGASPSQVDVVVELDKDTGEIVWEWNISDHVIQERDDALPNFGSSQANPQLLNMDAISRFDWTDRESFMINGMDYNADLDQIILSVRKMSELVIIDHSTSTEEAAGHTGGRYGKGGDILYRWGNPQNYNRGSAEQQELYFQHNPNWIDEGALKGQIICYNNGLTRPGSYSTAPILNPRIDQNGGYILEEGLPYLPLEAPIEYSSVHTNTQFFSEYTSGAQYLSNGNIFITEGSTGRLFETNPEGVLVWEYTIPFTYYTFRAKRYAYDYSGFDEQDMTPEGTLPYDNSTYDCGLFDLSTSTQTLETATSIFDVNFDWTDKELKVSNTLGNSFEIQIFNVAGQSVLHHTATAQAQLNLSQLPKGMYITRLEDHNLKAGYTLKIIIP